MFRVRWGRRSELHEMKWVRWMLTLSVAIYSVCCCCCCCYCCCDEFKPVFYKIIFTYLFFFAFCVFRTTHNELEKNRYMSFLFFSSDFCGVKTKATALPSFKERWQSGNLVVCTTPWMTRRAYCRHWGAKLNHSIDVLIWCRSVLPSVLWPCLLWAGRASGL